MTMKYYFIFFNNGIWKCFHVRQTQITALDFFSTHVNTTLHSSDNGSLLPGHKVDSILGRVNHKILLYPFLAM